MDPVGAEAAGDDRVGPGQLGVDITGVQPREGDHVGRVGRVARIRAIPARAVRARAAVAAAGDLGHPRRIGAGGHRRLQVEHRRQRLLLDPDARRAVLGRRLGLRDHQRDRLPRPHDLRARQWLGHAAGAARDLQVVERQDGHHTRHRQRVLRRDRRDPRVRLGGQHRPRVQQARDIEIAHVARGPADLLRTVAPPARDPDHARPRAKWYDVIRCQSSSRTCDMEPDATTASAPSHGSRLRRSSSPRSCPSVELAHQPFDRARRSGGMSRFLKWRSSTRTST